MATILDNKRAELDARIELLQAEINGLQTKLDQFLAQRRELDDYEPAVDPNEPEE
jgi:hypothetical protein